MSGNRAEFLRDYYRLLADDIRRSEAIIPQVCWFEAAMMALLLFVRLGHGPSYFATVLALLSSTWAIHLLINANFWARRSHLMAANVEEVFLSTDDLDILLPRAYYSDARVYRYRRVFRAPLLLSFGFFILSLGSIPLTANLKSFSILVLGVCLLWSVYFENRNCAREYAYLVAHAPGVGFGVAK
jgi:hypothetical protein